MLGPVPTSIGGDRVGGLVGRDRSWMLGLALILALAGSPVLAEEGDEGPAQVYDYIITAVTATPKAPGVFELKLMVTNAGESQGDQVDVAWTCDGYEPADVLRVETPKLGPIAAGKDAVALATLDLSSLSEEERAGVATVSGMVTLDAVDMNVENNSAYWEAQIPEVAGQANLEVTKADVDYRFPGDQERTGWVLVWIAAANYGGSAWSVDYTIAPEAGGEPLTTGSLTFGDASRYWEGQANWQVKPEQCGRTIPSTLSIVALNRKDGVSVETGRAARPLTIKIPRDLCNDDADQPPPPDETEAP